MEVANVANICPGLNVYLKVRHLNFPHVAVGRRDMFLEKYASFFLKNTCWYNGGMQKNKTAAGSDSS